MLKRLSCKILALLVASIYTIFTIYALQVLLVNENQKIHPKGLVVTSKSPTKFYRAPVKASQYRQTNLVEVEIWGKAAIGLYLWEHILEGPLEERLGGAWRYGEKQIQNIKFIFRTGPWVVPDKVPKQTKNLVLVINGREPKKVDFAKAWLESLQGFPNLRNVAVVLLGNERCDNDWLFSYMKNNEGLVTFAFIVYDITYADSEIYFQWPLGVATYRNFPNVPILSIDVQKPQDVCFIKTRGTWSPGESSKSANDYHYALANSDLTLNPVGMNTECYRIYEACSYGSVPVIEDVVTPGNCRKGEKSPLHLLKASKAPFIYVKDWNDLPMIIENEKHLTHGEVVERRKKVLLWYKTFKESMRDNFVETLQQHFAA
ncbi:Transmembrane protein 5 [Stylophora pistillata]|uniref:Transmembrane protein 5 n=1 Tax=Stylophora pistillata TaxID=50429 RepID=A0A2B4SM06_STYPI|nr:Transmembrane protein 5 [Stylophora pistillata]